MTLLPKETLTDQARFAGANTHRGRTCLSTSIDRLGTYTSVHLDILGGKPCAEFCDLGHAVLDKLLPATAWEGTFQGAREKAIETKLTRIHSHDEKHVGKLADLVRYRCGRRVRRDCYPGLHVSLMDRVDKGDGIRCDTVSVRDLELLWDGRPTCSFDMKAVEGSSGVCNVIHPLTTADLNYYKLQEKGVYTAPSLVQKPSYDSP